MSLPLWQWEPCPTSEVGEKDIRAFEDIACVRDPRRSGGRRLFASQPGAPLAGGTACHRLGGRRADSDSFIHLHSIRSDPHSVAHPDAHPDAVRNSHGHRDSNSDFYCDTDAYYDADAD